MTAPDLSTLAARLAEAITVHRTTKVPLTELRRAAHDADLGLAGHPDARRRLREVIDELTAAGIVQLPAGRTSWDNNAHPPLPAWVKRPPKARPTEPAEAPTPMTWHARLWWAARFVAHDRPTASELALLTAANRYAANDSDAPVVPIRERSYQLLGDEKALDTLSVGRLFTTYPLKLADLRCERLPLPVASWPVGDGPVTLLVENHTTAHTLACWLPAAGPVGAVIYSAGSQLPQILASLPANVDGPLSYFGDLDLRGIEIAADGNHRTAELGLGPLRPAAGLYRLLIDIGKPMPAKTRARTPSGPHVYAWLPDDIRRPTEKIINSGRRIPQEAVGVDALRQIDPSAFSPIGRGQA